MVSLNVNGKSYDVDVDPDTPLLWAIREGIGLTGTKYGCGQALCGACTVHLDGEAVRSCVTPLSRAADRKVTTIEGLANTALQDAWCDLAVPQCGFCQAGQLMTAAALLAEVPQPSDEQIDRSMAGNLCRCGTYSRIRAAIKRAAGAK